MKKIVFLASSIISFLTPARALATETYIEISPPPYGYKDLGAFVTNLVTIAFSVALIVVLVMLVWGAFEWIVSGGDKEAVGKARSRIINALIGLAVLAIAFALAKLGSDILGFPAFKIIIPAPS